MEISAKLGKMTEEIVAFVCEFSLWHVYVTQAGIDWNKFDDQARPECDAQKRFDKTSHSCN